MEFLFPRRDAMDASSEPNHHPSNRAWESSNNFLVVGFSFFGSYFGNFMQSRLALGTRYALFLNSFEMMFIFLPKELPGNLLSSGFMVKKNR